MPVGRISGVDIQVAGAEAEDSLHHIHRLTDVPSRSEWAEDAGAAEAGVGRIARHVDARKVILRRDREIGIGLPVGQHDIEPRPQILDQTSLCQQRLPLRLHLDDLKVSDARKQEPLARTEVGRC